MTQRILVVIAGLALGVAINNAPAPAQGIPGIFFPGNNRSFVSGHGSDSNTCSLSAPCRTFQLAHDYTNSGGEIVVLDTAGYGPVNITKAISINVPDGIEAGITTTTAVDAIAISAGASDIVNLRGLTLIGLGIGHDSIRFNSGGALNVRNCTIGGFTDDGINVSTSTDADISISDTVVSGNTLDGIAIFSGGASKVTAVLKRVQASNNGRYGILVDGEFGTGRIRATIADSIASHNNNNGAVKGIGILAQSGQSQASTVVSISRSEVVNNYFGIATSLANSYVSETVISGNTNPWQPCSALGAAVFGCTHSFGNNHVSGNDDDAFVTYNSYGTITER